MFKEQMSKIKSLIVRKEEKQDKKKIDNLVAFLIILIVTLIAINLILKEDEPQEENLDAEYKELAEDITTKSEENSYDELEKKLESILETMSGVRKSKCFNYIFSNF